MNAPRTHEQVQGLLSDYMEGNLSDVDRQTVDAHLETCSTCREELELLDRAMPLIKSMPRVQAPEGFVGRVRRQAHKSGVLARRRRRNLMRMSMPFPSIVTMAVLMAAVGAMLVVVLMMQQQIGFLIQQQPPVRLLVDQSEDLQKVAAEAWALGGEVRVADETLDPGSDLSMAMEIDLLVAKASLEAFFSALERAGLQSSWVESEGTQTSKSGEVRLLVQIRQTANR